MHVCLIDAAAFSDLFRSYLLT